MFLLMGFFFNSLTFTKFHCFFDGLLFISHGLWCVLVKIKVALLRFIQLSIVIMVICYHPLVHGKVSK